MAGEPAAATGAFIWKLFHRLEREVRHFDVTMTSLAATRAAALAEARTAGAVPRAARLKKILAGDVIGLMQSGASL